MSRTKPDRLPFCSKCKKAFNKRLDFEAFPDYFSIKFLYVSEKGVRCRCGKCGYEYFSNSRRAAKFALTGKHF